MTKLHELVVCKSSYIEWRSLFFSDSIYKIMESESTKTNKQTYIFTHNHKYSTNLTIVL